VPDSKVDLGDKNPEITEKDTDLSLTSERGLRLYGGFYFDSRGGELSSIYEDDKEIIPAGVVLVAVKDNYVLGYYEGNAEIEEGKGRLKLEKVFFTISKEGALKYYRPHKKDSRFLGEKINGRLIYK